jgi:Flp pilus assembly CpaF family ATPase
MFPVQGQDQKARIKWFQDFMPWVADGSPDHRPVNSNKDWTPNASRDLWGGAWSKLACLMADPTLNEIQVQALNTNPKRLSVMTEGPKGVQIHPDLEMSDLELLEGLNVLSSKALRGKGVRGAAGLSSSQELDCMLMTNLDDGPRESRLTAVVPPASEAPTLAIRRFPVSGLPEAVVVGEEELDRTVSPNAWPGEPMPEVAHPLERIELAAVHEKKEKPWASMTYRALYWVLAQFEYFEKNVVVYGPTKSGKTTMLQTLIQLTDLSLRIVAIEMDAHELFLPHVNKVSLFCTNPKRDPMRSPDLALDVSLRLSPEIIAFGELRGPEAYSFFQAVTSGHRGMTTVHAKSYREVVSRSIGMAQRGAPAGTEGSTIRELVLDAANILVQVKRVSYKVGGKARKVRRVTAIHEVVVDDVTGKPTFLEVFTTKLNADGEPCLVWTGNPGTLVESLENDHLSVPKWLVPSEHGFHPRS